MKRSMGVIEVLALAGAIAVSALNAAHAADQGQLGDAQWMNRMQAHWQTVIQESDPQKRAELMREHQQMMSEATGGPGSHMGGQSGHAGMSDSGHVDLMNTVNMHQHMMDMMR